MDWKRLSPREMAGLDFALADGIAEALSRASGLLVIKTSTTGDGGWICGYPPSGLSSVAAREWARRHGLCFSRDDLYLTRNEVLKAGTDMAASATELAREAPPANGLCAIFRNNEETSFPVPAFHLDAAAKRQTAARASDAPKLSTHNRAPRAWLSAFQAGFQAAAPPIEMDDDDAFIRLLEIADSRRPKRQTTNAGTP